MMAITSCFPYVSSFLCLAITVIGNGRGSYGADPVVTVDSGQLEGYVLSTPKGECDTYLGVPFAAPPVGDLRWRKPEPPAAWSGIRNAKEFGPKCIQWGSSGTDPSHESEDCLYLNVFVPKSNPDSSSGFPVMVFIHGGYFAFGTPIDMGKENICESLASRGVIIVELQYRLFLYGFYSTGDEAAPGNYATWDQIEGLKWVQRNIAQFGGDPNRVTIFGQSAGGCFVSYLTYTPVAKDLFHRSIAQSGSAHLDWTKFDDVSVTSAKMLAEAANCKNPKPEKFTDCMRNLSTAELQAAHNRMDADASFTSVPSYLPHVLYQWRMRVDGELYTEQELKELPTARPSIIGVTPWEMNMPTEDCIPMANKVLNDTLNDLINGSDTETKEMLKSIALYVYIDSKGDRNDPVFLCNQASKMRAHYGMQGFHTGAAKEATMKAAAGIPTRMYNFDYAAEYLFPPNYPFEKAAPHTQDLCYIFKWPGIPSVPCPPAYDGEYGKVADYMGEMWTNFAKTGNPSPAEIDWPLFSNVSHANTMTCRANLTVEPTFYIDAINFWNVLKPAIEANMDGKKHTRNKRELLKKLIQSRVI